MAGVGHQAQGHWRVGLAGRRGRGWRIGLVKDGDADELSLSLALSLSLSLTLSWSLSPKPRRNPDPDHKLPNPRLTRALTLNALPEP